MLETRSRWRRMEVCSVGPRACLCVCVFVGGGVQVKAGVRGIHAGVPGNTKLKIKPRLSFRWTCNPDIKPWSSTHLFTPPPPTQTAPSFIHPTRTHPPASPGGWPNSLPRRAHLQVCEGRRPTKADCVLIKFIICGELILNGNLSLLVLKESWITHLL